MYQTDLEAKKGRVSNIGEMSQLYLGHNTGDYITLLTFLELDCALRKGPVYKLVVAEISDKSVQVGVEAGQVAVRSEGLRQYLSLIVVQVLHAGQKLGEEFLEENWKIRGAHVVDGRANFVLQ